MSKIVLGAGLIAADHLYLKRKKKRELEYLGTSGGGSVGNTLCLLSLMGYDCKIFGVVGNNSIASVIRSDFDLFGVSHSLLAKRGKPNKLIKSRQYSHIINEKRSTHTFRTECVKCGESFTRDFQIAKNDLTKKVKEVAKTADIIHVDRANRITIELASIANKNNIPVTVDLGYISFKRDEIIKELLQKSITAKLNHKVFNQIVQENGIKGEKKWQDLFPNMENLVITAGNNGVYGFFNHNSRIVHFKEKSIPCRQLVDEGGAGDILMAFLISELILNTRKKSKNDIINSINRGQALSSLNCCLYGSRSLPRFFLRQDIRGDSIVDIADKIIKDQESGNSFDPKIGLPRNYDYIFRFAPETSCSICGSPKRKINSRSGIRKSTVYITDLSKSLFVMSKSFEMGKVNRDKYKIYREKPGFLVGSGGSFSAAIFGEEILLKLGGIPSKAITPFHLENMKFFDQGTPVCILSYGGSNTDIVKGAAFRLARAKISNCLIFCGDKESDLARIANRMNWHFMPLPAQERGFVSTVGMLAMISSLISIFVPDEIIEKASKTFEHENLNDLLIQASKLAAEQSNYIFANERNPHLVCVASGWGLPALTDFESKITEGGVCTIEIAEMKNFTHGRYINTFSYRKNRIMIIFQSPEDKELSQFLVKKFNRYLPVVVVKTEKNNIGGALELMVKGLFLAGKLGEKKGIDISKPHKYPPEARGLYGWEPNYRKGVDISRLLETA